MKKILSVVLLFALVVGSAAADTFFDPISGKIIQTPDDLTLGGASVSKEVATYAALRAYSTTNLSSGDVFFVRARATAGDGGDGHYRLITGAAASTYTDDGGVTLLPTGGDGSAAWVRLHGSEVFPEWFGATGDGTTNDATAISAALSYAVTNGDVLVLSGKNYVVASEMSVNIVTGNLDVQIRGAGQGSTRLSCSGVGCLAITAAEVSNVTISGVHFLPVGINRGTALEILAAPTSTNPYPKLLIEDCFFGSNTASDSPTNYFDIGIDFGSTNAYPWGEGRIDNCYFRGVTGANPTQMTAIKLRYANDVHINKCFIYNCFYGVYTSGYPVEGLQIQGCSMVLVKTGVYAHSSSANMPLVRVSNTHINYIYRGIDLLDYAQSFIQNNLLYTRPESTEAETTDIYLQDVSTTHITNNHFTTIAAAVTDQRCMELINCAYLKVNNNIIRRRHNGIVLTELLGNSVNYSEFLNNAFSDMLTADTSYVIDTATHTGNIFKGRRTDYRTVATLSGAQTIATATYTTVEFQGPSGVSPFELSTTATAGELLIPMGMELITIEGGLRLASVPSTSVVIFLVEKDTGAGFAEVSAHSFAGNALGSYRFSTRPLGVAGGDEIRIRVYQNSGGDLSINHNAVYTNLTVYME